MAPQGGKGGGKGVIDDFIPNFTMEKENERKKISLDYKANKKNPIKRTQAITG